MVTNFLHLGSGTAISVPISGAPANFANAGPGSTGLRVQEVEWAMRL
jgi:hypothetical protein